MERGCGGYQEGNYNLIQTQVRQSISWEKTFWHHLYRCRWAADLVRHSELKHNTGTYRQKLTVSFLSGFLNKLLNSSMHWTFEVVYKSCQFFSQTLHFLVNMHTKCNKYLSCNLTRTRLLSCSSCLCVYSPNPVGITRHTCLMAVDIDQK